MLTRSEAAPRLQGPLLGNPGNRVGENLERSCNADWARGRAPIAGFTFVEPWQSFGGGGVSGTDTRPPTKVAYRGQPHRLG